MVSCDPEEVPGKMVAAELAPSAFIFKMQYCTLLSNLKYPVLTVGGPDHPEGISFPSNPRMETFCEY